ncbi:hypothetical protein BG841_11705 [Marinobacter sp. X15-166B]|nr:hypothetical protein BG841_11705 [Marinobacter sp. X15-166B]
MEGDYPELQDNARVFLGEVSGRSKSSLRRYAPTAVAQVKQAFQALGYYHPEVRWELTNGAEPQLRLTAVPGEPVRIRSRTVDISGPARSDPQFSATLPRRPEVGDVLHHGRYDALRQTLQNRGSRLGYFDAEFTTHKLIVDPEAGVADIVLVYESGERYQLGAVTFEDGHGFDEMLLRQFVTIEPGEPYHADKVAGLNRDLLNSGYFAQVLVDAVPSDAEDRVIPVNVRLRPRAPRSVAAGVGFSTDVGPRFRGTWTEHWVNPSGHRRGADTELSAPRQNISAWYELPLDPPMTDAIRFTTGYQSEDIEDVTSERLTFGQQWQHGLESGWMQILSLRWEGERYRIGREVKQSSQLLLPGADYTKLQADSALDPSKGYRLQLGVAGAHRGVLSDVDLLHLQIMAKGLMTLADKHRLLVRLEAGGVATSSFDDVPPSLRFFAGGDQSVRGYGYETLSPQDDAGNTEGGRYLLVGSAEYQYAFANRWRVAAFYDAGNAINNLNDPLASGAGVGVRWISPVGPLRLDIAKGLNPDFGGGWRLHFSMGPEL